MFGNLYQGKRVLVTGHTGFKGSWLTTWLVNLGANVIGVSKNVPTQPSLFEELGLGNRIKDIREDVRNLDAMATLIQNERPDFVFHLAAQSIVSVSYTDPVETLTTNVMGTLAVLEGLRTVKHPCVAILITSDKCYENVEWIWGYRETDRLGGKDVYSSSKASAEVLIRSYCHSFFKDSAVRIAIGRAGNVIGGGDWAKDRIIVDCVRAWNEGRSVEIRSPRATRPWQHVLEPLSGYLTLGQAVARDQKLHGEPFNFGPRAEQNHTVVELLSDLGRHWGFQSPEQAYHVTADIPFREAGLLKLNCDKALADLKWKPNLDYSDTIGLVGAWYTHFYRNQGDIYAKTCEQIGFYEKKGLERGLVWST